MGLPALASKLEHHVKDPKTWALGGSSLPPLIQISLQSLRRDFPSTTDEWTGRHRRKRTFQSKTGIVGD